MKNRTVVLFLMLIACGSVRSQVNRTGIPLMSEYDAVAVAGSGSVISMARDARGVMYFGTRDNGIVSFDGTSWHHLRVTGDMKLLSLAADPEGTVYAGFSSGLAIIGQDAGGADKITLLPQRSFLTGPAYDGKPVTFIAADSAKVYFRSGRDLYAYSPVDDSISSLAGRLADSEGECEGIFSAGGRVFATFRGNGFYLLNGDSSLRIGNGIVNIPSGVVSVVPFSPSTVLIATATDGLFLLNTVTGEIRKNFLAPELSDRISRRKITGAIRLPENRIAVSTYFSGTIFIIDNNGNLLQEISPETAPVQPGPVLSMYCDFAANSLLWYATSGKIYRLYVSLPVDRVFTAPDEPAYPVEIFQAEGSVYFSCDSGLCRSYIDNAGRLRFTRSVRTGQAPLLIGALPSEGGEFPLFISDGKIYYTDAVDREIEVPSPESVTAVCADKSVRDRLFAATVSGNLCLLERPKEKWIVRRILKLPGDSLIVRSMMMSPSGEIWATAINDNLPVRVVFSERDTVCTVFGKERMAGMGALRSMAFVGNELYACTEKGLFLFKPESESFESDSVLLGDSFKGVRLDMIYKTPEGDVLVSGFDSRYFVALVTRTSQGYVVFRKQFGILPDAPVTDIDYIDGTIWMIKGGAAYTIDKNRLGYGYGSFTTYFTSVTSDRADLLASRHDSAGSGDRILSSPRFNPVKINRIGGRGGNISISWTTTYFVGDEGPQYRYKLEGRDEEWSHWERRSSIDYTGLKKRLYTFRLVPLTLTGMEGEETAFSFVVAGKWYLSLPAMIVYALIVLMTVIWMTKFLLEQRRDFRRNQRLPGAAGSSGRGHEIESKLSFRLAKLSSDFTAECEGKLTEALPEGFVLHGRGERQTGDFCLHSGNRERIIILAADSNAGERDDLVPLAASSALNKLLVMEPLSDAASLLEKISDLTGKRTGEKDLTDERVIKPSITVADIHPGKMKVSVASSSNICIRARAMKDSEVSQWEAGSFPDKEWTVSNGRYTVESYFPGIESADSTTHIVLRTTQGESSYYLFTDGYEEQVSGTTGMKFSRKNLSKLILDIQDFPMARQKEILAERLASWRGKSQQDDDFLVIGFRIGRQNSMPV